MPPDPPIPEIFPVEEAWKPLPRSHWTEVTAAHLLRRIGFTATPEAVRGALRRPILKTLDAAFRPGPGPRPSDRLKEFEATAHERHRSIRKDIDDPEKRRELLRELRREDAGHFRDFGMNWFRHAREPENSAREKFVLFLQNIFVVERRSVRETVLLNKLQRTLRGSIYLTYPELCKRVSREPAMIRYLDLNRSRPERPNENFARELFELFTLGEGNYSERDVREAARAFTGYRIRKRFQFDFRKNLHDDGYKTVFGARGRWDGDDVIDLVFQQPAARTFFIRELLGFYLGSDLPQEPYLEFLGERWANYNFSIRHLLDMVFQSRLFHHPAYRGTQIKSPVQFYLGLCQDLRLDVIPFQSKLFNQMRSMGQPFFNPPNVRGWLYGPKWINATTIDARRATVRYLFSRLREDRLNANQQMELEEARANDRANFLVQPERLRQTFDVPPGELAEHFVTYFATPPSRAPYKPVLEELLAAPDAENPLHRLRATVIALLQSPAYNLC